MKDKNNLKNNELQTELSIIEHSSEEDKLEEVTKKVIILEQKLDDYINRKISKRHAKSFK